MKRFGRRTFIQYSRKYTKGGWRCMAAPLLCICAALFLWSCAPVGGEDSSRNPASTQDPAVSQDSSLPDSGQDFAPSQDSTLPDSSQDSDWFQQVCQEFQVPQIPAEEFPRVDGSTATLPLSQGLYQLATGCSKEESLQAVVHTKTTNAYYNLVNGGTDLVIAYQAPESFFQYVKEQGEEIEIKAIGKDALVFLANSGNPVSSLTKEQLREIYAGQRANWKDVGGENMEIVAFQRPEGSGSQTLMEKLVMGEVPMASAPSDRIQTEMGELIDAVASYSNEKNALGYSVYFYARNMYAQPELKFMAVDGVLPDNETIRSGQYPFVNDFYAVIRKEEPENSRARELFEWLTADGGQSFIESLGYVSVSAPQKEFPQLPSGGQGKGKLELSSGSRLFLDGSLISENQGIAEILADGTLAWMTRDNSLFGEQAVLTGPGGNLLVKDVKTGLAGVRALDGAWLVPAEYDWIERSKTGGFRAALGEKTLIFSHSGELILEVGGEGYLGAAMDCGIWQVERSTGKAVCYDWNGNEIGKVDLGTYGQFDYAYEVEGGMVWVSFNDHSAVLFYPDGRLYFDPSTIPEEVKQTLGEGQGAELLQLRCVGDGALVALDNWNEIFLYNRESRSLVSQDGDVVQTVDGAFSIRRDGIRFLLGADGRELKDREGSRFEYGAGEGLYYRVRTASGSQPGLVVIGDGTGETEYRLEGDFKWNIRVRAVNEQMFLVTDEGAGSCGFYLGEQKLAQGEELYVAAHPEGRVELTEPGKGMKMFDSQGNLVYEGQEGEITLLASDGVFVTQIGNYVYVKDGQKREVARFLEGRYWGD